MLDSAISDLKDWTKSTLLEWRQSLAPQGPPPAVPALGPPILAPAVSVPPPSWSGEAMSVLASEGEWDEEEMASDSSTLPHTTESQETSTGGGPPSLIPVGPPPPQVSGEMAPPVTPAARAGLAVPGDDVLFPPPPVLPPSSLVDDLATTLQRIEEICHVGIAARPAPVTGSTSRRSLTTQAPREPEDPSLEFPIDSSVFQRFERWARAGPKEWTSFSKEQDKALRVPQADFDRLIKVPPIPAAVGGLLCDPPSGPPKASRTATGGYRLSNPSVQQREEMLKATDRATRTALKYQALAQWSAESIAELVRGSAIEGSLAPFLQCLGQLSDATVDQLARISVRLTTERRENLLPMLGLSDRTLTDLRRLPCEAPDLFAGHFEHILARQAGQQDTLKRNLRLAGKVPKRPAAQRAAPTAKEGKRRAAPKRKRPAPARRAPAAASRAPQAATAAAPSPMSVTVAAGGRRVSSYATKRKSQGAQRRF